MVTQNRKICLISFQLIFQHPPGMPPPPGMGGPGMPPGPPPPNFSVPPPGFNPPNSNVPPPQSNSGSNDSKPSDNGELWVETKSADGKVSLQVH